MKKVFYLYILTVFLASCQKNFLDINTNPNNPTVVSALSVLTNALSKSAQMVATSYVDMNGVQNYYGSASWGPTPGPLSNNNFTSSNYQGVWSDHYHNINDYQYVVNQASANNQWFLVAISKAMIAMHFQMLVDTYNDVPYSQANMLDKNGNIFPVYDKAQDIYTACIKQLDSSVSLFENTALINAYNPGTADIMFQGNATLWAKFVNTLKLRMLLHEVGVSSQQSFIKSEMALIAADKNGLLGAGQSALVNPGYATDKAAHLNPLWSTIGYSINGNTANYPAVANSYFISKLNSYNDPRLGYFYAVNINGVIIGSTLGGISSNPIASSFGGTINLKYKNNIPFNDTLPSGVSKPTNFGLLQSATMPSIVLPSWESLFLQAEAVQRGLLPGDAQSLFNQAITDNFVYLKVTFGPNNTYIPSSSAYAKEYYTQNIANVGWAASTDKLYAIFVQKWISLCFTDPLESWSDYRRTGYPTDLPFTNNPSKLYNYPYRFIYPQSEYNTNPDNVNKEGIITCVSPKIFWMP